jgi:hypothetical protein
MPTSAPLVSVGPWWHAVARVTDLRPGDLVTNGGDSAVHITHTEHPAWPVLQLVVWRLQDGTISLDALSPDQEVGDVTAATLAERIDRLVAAVRGEASQDDLRVRVHRHLKAHPGLSAWETAAALKSDGVTVRNLLYAMAEDGEAQPDTTGPVTKWTAT